MILDFFRSGQTRTLKLEGSRVHLRPPQTTDWRAWASLRQQSREFLAPWEPTWPQNALNRDAFRRRVRQNTQEWRDAMGFSFFIFRDSDAALLGGISLSNVRRGVAQTGTLGYWIGAPHARQGYMTEALTITVDFAFEDLALHRLEAACLEANIASKTLLLNAGFKQQGMARQYLRINGRWQDHLLFDKLASDPRYDLKQKKMNG